MATLDLAVSREFDPGFVAPRPDFGPANAFQQAAKMGFNSNFTGMGYRATKYWAMKLTAEQQAPTSPDVGVGKSQDPQLFVTKEQFDKEFSLNGTLKFDPHYDGKMSRRYAEELMNDHIDDQLTEAKASMSYAPVASFAGGIAGSLLSPVDLAVNVAIPEYAFAKWGMGATVASRAGTGAARLVARTANGAVNGAIQGAAFQIPMTALAANNQTEYGVSDVLSNMVAAPVLGAAGGLVHGAAKHAFGEWDRAFANAAMHAAATGEKDGKILGKIFSSDPRTKEAAANVDRIKTILSKEIITPEELAELHAKFPPDQIPDLRAKAADAMREFTAKRDAAKAREDFLATATPEQIAEMKAQEKGRTVFMAAEGSALPAQRSRAYKIIDEVLANPEDKRIGGAISDDEKFLSEAWHNMFGSELKFIDPAFAKGLGIDGFTKPENPSLAYVARGTAQDMAFVAGHELGHQVRMRDPRMWSDMVDAMMKTAQEDDGALAEAWLTTVRRGQAGSAWAGLDMHGKMDETFATVLGRAMHSDKFWSNLQYSGSGFKFMMTVAKIRDRLAAMLDKRITKQTSDLYDALSTAMVKADAAGLKLKDKQVLDAKGLDLAALNAPHAGEFKAMTRRLSAELNKSGAAHEKQLASFIETIDSLFPQVASFTDESTERFTTVLKNKRIDSGNPGLWLIQNILSKSKPGTKEREIATRFLDTMDPDRFKWDGKSRTPKGEKDYVPSAMAEFNKLGVLATFKKNADGTWDIGIHRNDEFPRWQELLPKDEASNAELVADTFMQDQMSTLVDEFSRFVNGTKGKEDAPAIDEEFRQFLHTLDRGELHEMVHQDPGALWHAYSEHLHDKALTYLRENDQKAYENAMEAGDRLDPLLRPDSAKDNSSKFDPSNVQAAWDKFRKGYPVIQQRLTDRKLEMAPSNIQGPMTAGLSEVPTREFFDDLFKEIREEVINYMREHEQAGVIIRAFLDQPDKHPNFLSKESNLKFSDHANQIIDEETRNRIRAVYPHYDRVMQIESAVKAKDNETISIHTANPRELGELHKDATELFDNQHFFEDQSSSWGSFMAAEPKDVADLATSKKLSAEEAGRLARTRLDRDHAYWAKFLTNYDTAAKTHLDAALVRNKIEGWSLDLDAKKTEGDKVPTGALVDQLDLVKSAYGFAQKQLNKILKNEATDPGYASEVVQSRWEYNLRQADGDRFRAVEQTAADLRRDAQSRALAAVADYEARKSLRGLLKQGLDTLYSYLDGSPRKGVKSAGASASEAMTSRIQADTTPLVHDLIESGLDPLWVANDETLVRAVIGGLKGREIKDPMVRRIVDTLKKTNEVQTGRLNAFGANIRLLDGFAFSQVHNPHAISRNKVEFIADLEKWLDWEATTKATGMYDKAGYLEGAWEYLKKTEKALPDNFDPNTMGGNIAGQVSHRRTLYFKDTAAFDYDMKYGSGNTAGLITEQIVKRAELGTIMEHFGADYKKTWDSVMQDAGRSKVWKFQKLGRIDMTFQHLTGDLNHPENVKLAAMGQATRQYMNSVALWMSGVSSVSDIPNTTATMTWMGMSPRDLNSKLISAMKEQAFKSPKDREFLLAQGAGLQAILSAFSRTQVMNGPAYRFAQKASDFTFKYNGQEIWTKTLQSAFHDLTTQHLGEMARVKELTPEFTNWLNHYGITPDEWAAMSKHATEIDGLHGVRLAPDLVPDAALADKLRVAMSDSMHHAILEPSVSDKALLTLGTKAGTVFGESVRAAMQYKAYPMAMVRRVQRRFTNAYGNEGLWQFGSQINQGQLNWLIWAGSMLSVATTVLSIKDMLRGREPMNPFDKEQWTLGNASRIISTAGVGPFAVAEQFLSTRQALGPAIGGAADLATGIFSGNGYRTTNAAVGLMPGASIIPIREASKAMLGSIFTETYGVHYQMFLRRLEQESGQSSIYLAKNPK